MKIWLKRFSILLAIVIAIITVINSAMPPSPEDCSICGQLKCHAPCLLNLATGEIGELELYQPHHQKVGEIAQEQTGGTFSFIHLSGLQGIRLTNPWYIELDVPMEGGKKNQTSFCRKCRKMLDEFEQGYVLLDLYDLDNPVVYGFDDGASYEIRCYQIVITAKWTDHAFHMRVNGTLAQ